MEVCDILTKKKNHCGLAVSEILQYNYTDKHPVSFLRGLDIIILGNRQTNINMKNHDLLIYITFGEYLNDI